VHGSRRVAVDRRTSVVEPRLANEGRHLAGLKEGEGVRWIPAYRAYFSSGWIGDSSVERLLEAMRLAGSAVPDLPLLIEPEELVGLLAKYDILRKAMRDDGPDSGEVSLDEDEDRPVDEDARHRWMRFLQWVGVNKALRLVPLHDVDDKGHGWISTANFRRPNGHAFQSIGSATWDRWAEPARHASVKAKPGEGTRYLYEVHDIEASGVVPAAAKADIRVASALFRHLSRNWDVYARFVEARAALVEPGKVLGQRAKPIQAVAPRRARDR
jgi:hypothetical protein